MELPETLVNALAESKVIPFVGAGVSFAVRRGNNVRLFPSWHELLEAAARKLEKEQKGTYANLVRSLIEIDTPDYLSAAKYARNSLGPVWFHFLKEQLDHPRAEASEETLALARAVWNLGSNLIITTNYDRTLTWTCPRMNDIVEWDIEAPVEQAALLRGDMERPVVWHLHGKIDNASAMILTPDGYNRLYPEDGVSATRYSAAFMTLRNLLASRSFLFLGFSLDDTRFGLQIRAVSDLFDGATGPHYALIHEEQVEAVRSLFLPGLEIVSFQDFGPPLLDLVNRLAAVVVKPHLPRSASQIEAKTPSANTTPVAEDFDAECDSPAPIHKWVGRADELL